MIPAPDSLELRLHYPPYGEGHLDVRPVVNGRDLLAEFPTLDGASAPNYVTTGPRYLLGRSGALLGAAAPREVRLAISGCGYEGCCGALYVTVGREDGQIVWSGWRDPGNRLPALPEFRFDAVAYEAEVRRAAADRSWEWPGVVVAQLLEADLRGASEWLERWDCEVEAVCASRAEPDGIEVMLRHPAGLGEESFQLQIELPVGDRDPGERAAQLAAELTAGDPRTDAKFWAGSTELAERMGYPWPPDHDGYR
ncbi:hypothetical protein GCM10020229_69000 [Kitasatospora albolonga]|uniref:hypothetical protein n=1 Tax=Kitasatospora albolonga TaxID=68173 RepID=UPI0031E83E78